MTTEFLHYRARNILMKLIIVNKINHDFNVGYNILEIKRYVKKEEYIIFIHSPSSPYCKVMLSILILYPINSRKKSY